MRNISLNPFVEEFIIFVANYRLANDIPNITIKELMNLVPIFIEKYYKGKPFTMKKQGERK